MGMAFKQNGQARVAASDPSREKEQKCSALGSIVLAVNRAWGKAHFCHKGM